MTRTDAASATGSHAAEVAWAVVFDLDETLIVEERAVVEALQATAALVPAERGVASVALAEAVRRIARDRWRAYEGWPWAHQVGISSWEALGAAFDVPGEPWARLRNFVGPYRQAVWEQALAEVGVRDAALAARLAARYAPELGPRRAPYPETFAVLRALRPHVRLGLLTNGAPDLQREKARAAGLLPWFDEVLVSGDLGVGKPDPALFHHLLARLGVAPERATMVGDNPERDVAGALAAGMRAVWIDRTRAAPPPAHTPHLRVATLDEALPHLAQWREGA